MHHFSDSDKPRMLFFLFVNVKMPTVVGILTFLSRKNFMLSSACKKFYNLGARLTRQVKSNVLSCPRSGKGISSFFLLIFIE